jgi:GT2 family glycosyltransferase
LEAPKDLLKEREAVDRCEVVIVNFNAGGFLKDAVGSVLRCGAVAHVYVIDNLSTDESLSLLPYPQSDQLTIIRNSANLGFATGSNIGLARAVCPKTCFCLIPTAR